MKLYYYFQKLKETIGNKLYRKVKRIRLAFLYTTVFALIWIPYGLVTVLRSFTEKPRAVVVDYNVKGRSPKKTLQTWFENLFATFHPVFYLYTHHHSRFISFLRMCRRKLQGQQNPRSEEVKAISFFEQHYKSLLPIQSQFLSAEYVCMCVVQWIVHGGKKKRDTQRHERRKCRKS